MDKTKRTDQAFVQLIFSLSIYEAFFLEKSTFGPEQLSRIVAGVSVLQIARDSAKISRFQKHYLNH